MIMMMTERPLPQGFDPADEALMGRHCRIAIDSMAKLGGRMHWVCSYVTEDAIVGVTFVESEADMAAFQAAAGIQDQPIRVSRVLRRLDPGLAE